MICFSSLSALNNLCYNARFERMSVTQILSNQMNVTHIARCAAARCTTGNRSLTRINKCVERCKILSQLIIFFFFLILPCYDICEVIFCFIF